MLKHLSKQLMIRKTTLENSAVTSPIDNNSLKKEIPFLKKLSQKALDLYERKSDIKKFTNLVLSDKQDLSHNDRVKEILSKQDDEMFDLLSNEKFLKDLGISE